MGRVMGEGYNASISISYRNPLLHLRPSSCILKPRVTLMNTSGPNQANRRNIVLSTAIISVGLIIIGVGVTGPA